MADMRLKWYGTAAMLLEHGGTQLLFDPFLSLNGKSNNSFVDELSAAEYIFITHGHIDHIADISAILKHGNEKTTVYCTEKPRATLISKGVNAERIQKIAPGDVLNFGAFEVTVLKGKHIIFDAGLIIKTLFSPRIFFNWSNFKYL